MDKRSQPTPTPAAKRPAPSPDTSTEDDAAKIQRCASPQPTATINDSPLKIIPGISTDDDGNAPPTFSEIDVRSKEIGQKYLSYTKYFYKEARRVKVGDNNEYYVIKANAPVICIPGSLGAGDYGDIAVPKCRDLTFDESRQCRRCAGVLIARQNANLCHILKTRGLSLYICIV